MRPHVALISGFGTEDDEDEDDLSRAAGSNGSFFDDAGMHVMLISF